jgi:hypothetical protein
VSGSRQTVTLDRACDVGFASGLTSLLGLCGVAKPKFWGQNALLGVIFSQFPGRLQALSSSSITTVRNV